MLAQKLPWTREWSTVTTDAIDLRGAVGSTVKEQEPSQVDAVGSELEQRLTEALRRSEAVPTNGHAEAAYDFGTIYEFGLPAASDPEQK